MLNVSRLPLVQDKIVEVYVLSISDISENISHYTPSGHSAGRAWTGTQV
jgi:hypothetical protein